jgi:hypothetical protein
MSTNPAEAPQQLPEQPSALERLGELNALLNGQTGSSVEDYAHDSAAVPQNHAGRERLVHDYFTRQFAEEQAATPIGAQQGSNGTRVFGQGNGGTSYEGGPHVVAEPEATLQEPKSEQGPSNIAQILAPENYNGNAVSATVEREAPAPANAAQEEFSPEDVQFFEGLRTMTAQEKTKAIRERSLDADVPGGAGPIASDYLRYLNSLPKATTAPQAQGGEESYVPSRSGLATRKGQVHEFKRIMSLPEDERAEALDQLNQTEQHWYGDYSRNHQAKSPENQRRRRLKIAAAAGVVATGAVLAVGTYMAMKHGHDTSAIHHMLGTLKPTKGTPTVPTPKVVGNPQLFHGIASAAQAASNATHVGASAGSSAGHAAAGAANHAPTVHFSPAEITQAHTTAYSLSEHLPHGFEQMQGFADKAIKSGDLKQVGNNGSYYWELTAKGAAKIGAHGNKSNLGNVMKLLSTYSNGQMSAS